MLFRSILARHAKEGRITPQQSAPLMIAQESADAERERLRLGSTIFASLRDAEEAVREASLRAAKAQVDLAKARLELDHLTGQLLARIAPMLTP